MSALPADDPGQSLGADVQSGSDVRVVQVEGGGGGVSAGRVQTDRQVERRQTSQLLHTEEKLRQSLRQLSVT